MADFLTIAVVGFINLRHSAEDYPPALQLAAVAAKLHQKKREKQTLLSSDRRRGTAIEELPDTAKHLSAKGRQMAT